MKFNYKYLLLFFFGLLASCSSDDDYQGIDSEESPVQLDLSQVPYPKLSDYVFFKEVLKDQIPVYGVIPFQPASSLFTDYALKKRFVWMPDNTKATYAGDGEILDLPVGAALIKTFYYNNVQPENSTKILETRLLIKKQDNWIFANYVWNEEQTEAYLDTEGLDVDITWYDSNGNLRNTIYNIPSAQDCNICHGDFLLNKDLPLGIKPQNLNFNYTFDDGIKNQLQKWIDFGYLEDNLPLNILSIIDYEDTSQSLDLRARSYLDVNCSGCHKDGGYADFYVLRLAFDKTTVDENIGICQIPGHQMPGFEGDYLLTPGNHEHSMLFARMNTNDFYYKMPMRGRSIIHDEGNALIAQWIDAMPPVVCD